MYKLKSCLLILFIVFSFFLYAEWSELTYARKAVNVNYLSSSNTPSFVSDSLGNMFLILFNDFDAYYSIIVEYYDGTDWSYPAQIEDAPNGGGLYQYSMMPSMSVEPNGNRLYIWEDMQSGAFEIYSKYDNNIQISSQMQITNSNYYSWNPKLKYGAGIHNLIYKDNVSGVFNIYYNYYDTIWHENINIINSENNCYDYSLHAYDNGEISIIYTQNNNGFISLYNIRKDTDWETPIAVYSLESDVYSPFLIANDNYEYAIFTTSFNGISQLFMSQYKNNTWTSAQLLSQNNYNIYSPSALIKNDTLHIFYISDEYINGVIYDLKYNVINDQIIERELVIERRSGEIYTPHSLLTPDGNMHLIFLCLDGDSTGYSRLCNVYYTHTLYSENTGEDDGSPYLISYSDYNIIIDFYDEVEQMLIIDKTGRIIKEINNPYNKYFLNSNILKKNDVYFVYFKTPNKNYSEKILWLK